MIELYSKLRNALTKSKAHQPTAQAQDEESWLEIHFSIQNHFSFDLQCGGKTAE